MITSGWRAFAAWAEPSVEPLSTTTTRAGVVWAANESRTSSSLSPPFQFGM